MNPTVSGSLNISGSTVEVNYFGSYRFAQVNGIGYYHYYPTSTFTSSGVENTPPDSGMIALEYGGTKIITFSQTVRDPVLALVSWNSNTVDFGVPIEILSYGPGPYPGMGIPVLNSSGTGLNGVLGEVNGVIRLPGEFTSITFTDTSEGWHGFTAGVTSLPQNSVPEPSTMILIGIGYVVLAGVRRLA